MKHIYLDHNASTPMAPEVVNAMEPFLHQHFGNPSAGHWAASPAREAVDKARAQVASLLACRPTEIVFTSGGSEANNQAIKGTFYAGRARGNHIITSVIEHPAVIQPCRFLENQGAQISLVPVDGRGRVDPEDIRRAITPQTILISIMHANNETGSIQPIAEIAKIAKEHKISFHTDAAQSVGKIPTRVDDLGVDLLSVAGHKLYGPKGIGALYIRSGTELEPLIHGAGHESGRRAGTENVLLDVGLGAACALAQKNSNYENIQALRDRFFSALQEKFGKQIVLNGHLGERLPNTLNVSFVGRKGYELLPILEQAGIAASTGSACHAGAVSLSPVLQAMGIPEETGIGTIRFSLGRNTVWEDLQYVLEILS